MAPEVSSSPKISIVHMSDLHFGTVVSKLCEPLLERIEKSQPALVVVSGDLTQRARRYQFERAAEFLDQIKFPKLVVPGNHDMPLWNLYRRFYNSLDDYRQIIASDIEPVYRSNRLIAAGINSARAIEWKEGRVSGEQIRKLEEAFKEAKDTQFKIVVMHHPLIDCVVDRDFPVVDGADEALESIMKIGADMVLSGHLHHQYACQSVHKRAILVIQAGTALSSRTRGMRNSFNVVEIESDDCVNLIIYEWDVPEQTFVRGRLMRFEQRGLWKLVQNESL